MAKKDSVEVIYTPHRSMPQNFPGDFKVKGWGTVVLHPKVPTKLGINLAKVLIRDCGDRVKLADPSDWKSLGKEFKPVESPVEETPAETLAEDAPESAEPAEEAKQDEKAGEA